MDSARRHDLAVARDPTSLRDVLRRLLVHARALGASREEAEDLVHDTVEVVVAEPAWYDSGRASLVGALKVVLRNRLLNRVRGRKVHERHQAALRLVEPTDPADPVVTEEARVHRQRFLALLEPDERALFAVWLRQRAGERAADLARELGLTEPAYEAAKKRLRRRCLAALDELGLTPTDLFDPPGTP